MSRIGQESGPCPKCGQPTTLTDFNSVDIGVGDQEFDHEYTCARCGRFGYVTAHEETPSIHAKSVAVFEDGSRAES